MSIERNAFDVGMYDAILEVDGIGDASRAVLSEAGAGGHLLSYLFKLAPSFADDGNAADETIKSLIDSEEGAAMRGQTAMSFCGSVAAMRELLRRKREQQQQENAAAKSEKRKPRKVDKKASADDIEAAAEAAGVGRELEAMSGTGWTRDGQGAPPDASFVADVLHMVDRLRGLKRLGKLSSLVGRLRAIADAVRRDGGVKGEGRPRGVGRGGLDAIGRLMPTERALLTGAAGPSGAKLAKLKLSEGEASVIEGAGISRSGQGPMLVAFDTSGSMDQQTNEAPGIDGRPPTMLDVSVAIAWSLAAMAAKDRRRFDAFGFDDSPHSHVTGARGFLGLSEQSALLCQRVKGGTNFDRALTECASIFERAGGSRPDVVFITDGAAPVAEEVAHRINALRAGSGLRVIVIGVGFQGFGQRRPNGSKLDGTILDVADEVYAAPSGTIAELDEAMRSAFKRRA